MANTIEDLSREDLLTIVKRDRWVKEQLSARIGNLMHENVELAGIINEQAADLQSLRQGQAVLNGDAAGVPVDVTS